MKKILTVNRGRTVEQGKNHSGVGEDLHAAEQRSTASRTRFTFANMTGHSPVTEPVPSTAPEGKQL